MSKSKRIMQPLNKENRMDGLTSHDRITLTEAKNRMAGKNKFRGGMTDSRYRRMIRRGHALLDWMQPKK